MTVLVIAVMGVAVAITYARLSSERRITSDGQAQIDAFSVAQSGLSTYLSNLNAKPVNPGPWGANVNVTGGTARVDMVMVRESTTTLLPAVYIVTSRGTATSATRFDARTPPAERTVAAYAQWVPAPFDLNAGVTSLVGVSSNGNSSHFSGIDRCGAGASIPGVATPDGAWDPGAHPNVVDGIPDNAGVGMGSGGTAGGAKDEVDIDWAGIVAGTAFPADYTAPAWPASFADWPVLRANGDYTLPGDGKGILIVTGNLTIVGSKQWEGLILVGGSLTGNGNSSVYGAIITGLNIKLGIAVIPYDVGNGNKTWQYDSCSLTRALGHIGSIQRVRNGWTDTWSSY